MGKKVAKLRQCDREFLQKKLGTALEHLEIFLVPEDERCGIDPEVRKAAKLYLSTWVAPALREALLWAHGEPVEPSFVTTDEWKRRQVRLKEILEEVALS